MNTTHHIPFSGLRAVNCRSLRTNGKEELVFHESLFMVYLYQCFMKACLWFIYINVTACRYWFDLCQIITIQYVLLAGFSKSVPAPSRTLTSDHEEPLRSTVGPVTFNSRTLTSDHEELLRSTVGPVTFSTHPASHEPRDDRWLPSLISPLQWLWACRSRQGLSINRLGFI